MNSYLCGYIRMFDGVLEVRHEHQIASLVPAVMECVVINVTKDRTCTDAIRVVLGVNKLAQFIHHLL